MEIYITDRNSNSLYTQTVSNIFKAVTKDKTVYHYKDSMTVTFVAPDVKRVG